MAHRFNRPGNIQPPPSQRLPNGVSVYYKHQEFITLEVPGLNYFCTVPRQPAQLALLRDAVNFLLENKKEKAK